MNVYRFAAGFAFVALSLVACTRPVAQPVAQPIAQQPQAAPATGEQAVAPERNPPGDIPDDQVFITFASPTAGYQVQVPQGWARSTNADDVRFVDKLGGVQVAISSTAQAPTAATAQNSQAADLQRAGRAVKVNNVSDVRLPNGDAVFIDYASNSEPDQVTGKQIRLENQVYLFYKDGKLATLSMWAPLGADNADQWQLMARSFKWQ